MLARLIPLIWVLLTLAVEAPVAAQATPRRPVSPSSFHQLQQVGEARWSPVDDRIVFTVRRSNPERDGYSSDLWVVNADGSGLRQLTFQPSDDRSPRWSADGSEILFVSDRGGSNQAWLLPAAGGEPRCLTPFDVGVSQVRWVPGKREISFVARVPSDSAGGPKPIAELGKPTNPELEMGVRVIRQAIYRAGTSYFDGLRSFLFALDVDGGEVRQLTYGEADVREYSWAPDGARVLVTIGRIGDPTDAQLNQVRVLDARGVTLQILNEEHGYFRGIWHPGSETALVIESSWEGRNQRLHRVDLSDESWTLLETGFDGDHLAWRFTPDGSGVHALTPQRGEVHVWEFDARTMTGRQVTSGRRQFGFHSQMFRDPCFSVSADGKRFVASATNSVRPAELVVGNMKNGNVEPITDLNKRWRDGLKLSEARKFTFGSFDGRATEAWLIPPVDLQQGRKYPLVLEIHGGPRTMYGEHFMLEFQALASQGHGVLYVNPRGSSGYGEQSTRAVLDDWGGGDYKDLMMAVDVAISGNDWIDAERLGVAGGSYGGFMTAWIIGHTERFKAAVPMRGVYNHYSFPLTTDIPHFTEFEFGSLLWGDPEKYWRMSPLAYADKIKTPTLIIHADRDFRAPVPDAEQLYVALRLHGVPAEFVRYLDEGHGLSRGGRPDRLVDRLERIVGWFRRWL